jgi:hypothetical protein
MPNRKKLAQRDPLPENFDSLEKFWDFWDTHSTIDYEDLMEPVEIEFTLSSRKIYCPIAKDVFAQVQTQALQQGISPETLINLWLKEKVSRLA